MFCFDESGEKYLERFENFDQGLSKDKKAELVWGRECERQYGKNSLSSGTIRKEIGNKNG